MTMIHSKLLQACLAIPEGISLKAGKSLGIFAFMLVRKRLNSIITVFDLDWNHHRIVSREQAQCLFMCLNCLLMINWFMCSFAGRSLFSSCHICQAMKFSISLLIFIIEWWWWYLMLFSNYCFCYFMLEFIFNSVYIKF